MISFTPFIFMNMELEVFKDLMFMVIMVEGFVVNIGQISGRGGGPRSRTGPSNVQGI